MSHIFQKYLLLVSYIIIANAVHGQTTSLFSGIVVDSLTKKKIAGANILIFANTRDQRPLRQTKSGRTGGFYFNTQPGCYYITVSKEGYLKTSRLIVIKDKSFPKKTVFSLLIDFNELSRQLDSLSDSHKGRAETFNFADNDNILKRLDEYLRKIRQ